jgi:hypothetical protein
MSTADQGSQALLDQANFDYGSTKLRAVVRVRRRFLVTHPTQCAKTLVVTGGVHVSQGTKSA